MTYEPASITANTGPITEVITSPMMNPILGGSGLVLQFSLDTGIVECGSSSAMRYLRTHEAARVGTSLLELVQEVAQVELGLSLLRETRLPIFIYGRLLRSGTVVRLCMMCRNPRIPSNIGLAVVKAMPHEVEDDWPGHVMSMA